MTAGSIAKTEMDDLVARLDRDNFPYGCFADWPPALKVTTRMMMASRFPMFIAWGEELPFLYNGACIPIFGARHPDAFGRPFKQVWPEVWDELSPLLFRALQGETIYRERLPLQLWRDGRMQPAWFTFSYSPLFDADGA
ncbi:MAG: PAS domain-containing protein, partial [Sandaracinobacteroides sp.]